MEPAYATGSVVFIDTNATSSQIATGDTIAYFLSDGATVITHRVIEIDGTERLFTTKGDANNTEDGPVPFESLIGRALGFYIPQLGYLLLMAGTTQGIAVVMFGVAFIALLFLIPVILTPAKDAGTRGERRSGKTKSGKHAAGGSNTSTHTPKGRHTQATQFINTALNDPKAVLCVVTAALAFSAIGIEPTLALFTAQSETAVNIIQITNDMNQQQKSITQQSIAEPISEPEQDEDATDSQDGKDGEDPTTEPETASSEDFPAEAEESLPAPSAPEPTDDAAETSGSQAPAPAQQNTPASKENTQPSQQLSSTESGEGTTASQVKHTTPMNATSDEGGGSNG
jgi:signal peptidase I